ncbi:hypothetical protein CDQ83_02885 [Clostridium thermosuccinogenes]|nr:hypothetical protein CDQ83_02885 [Pseudoclostridium thermosuccinogenes]
MHNMILVGKITPKTGGMEMNRRLKHIITQIFILVLIFSINLNVYALDGIWHNPTGWDDLYGGKEVGTEPCERYPRDPIAGENVYIKSKTWPIELGQAVWVTWKKNGVEQPVVNAQWKYNDGYDSYWEANLGSFAKGDVVEYTVHADHYGQNRKSTDTYSFVVTGWDSVKDVISFTNYNNRVEFTCSSESGTLNPKISFSFPGSGYFRMQFEPLGNGTFSGGLANYTVDSSNPAYVLINGPDIKLKVFKTPYKLEVYDANNNLLTTEYDRSQGRSLAFLTNGTNYVSKIEENLFTPADETFSGFGMRYNAINQRGKNVDIYTVNWYLDQDNKTYLPVPFYISNKNYGIFLNSTYYSQFRLATDASDKATIRVNAGGYTNTNLDMYFFSGTPKEISVKYTDVVGKPEIPPVWAFGPWISANEWNKQSEVEEQIAKTLQYDIPTSAMVVEAWADEETFYIWGDAQYTPRDANWIPTMSDFTFGGRWPNPKGFIDYAHANNIKVLLWQLPVIKSSSNPIPQLATDEAYALQQGYVLGDGKGGAYRMAPGWYGNSVLPDFTNPAAAQWYLNKRRYLLEEMGIDGFKCDGGEFVWGRNITSFGGIKGDELRNLYPDLYINAYYDFAKTYNADSVIFSRAGGALAGQHPISWSGDQRSSFSAYRDAMRACITASMSGVPFVTWDLAGFNGDIPSTELYKRSVAQAAFSPIMQLHSESGGDPYPSVARTPWNMYERTGDIDCINIYRKFANMRMSLIPYLYNEAKYTNATGVPMMRSMAYEFPDDAVAETMEFQYMLGGNLLVAPIENEGQTSKLIYLPEGEWIDLFWGAKRPGESFITYYAGLDTIPVFVRAGSVLPMNLNSDYDFGGSVGNDTTSYKNLTFRIYPSGQTNYDWYDYVDKVQRSLSVNENYAASQITINAPVMNRTCTLQVFSGKPGAVKFGNTAISSFNDLAAFKAASSGWYYDAQQHLTYIKVPASTSSAIILENVHEVPYEAEYATLNGVDVNTNHAGYEGTGFVDNFAQAGKSVEFEIHAPANMVYTLDIRYSAGTENATRNLYVNGEIHSTVDLPKTADWDTWGTVTKSITLNKGKNTIRLSYDSGNKAGINLDNITVRKN